MEEESFKTSDQNPEEVQGGIPDLGDELEDACGASQEMHATIRRQTNIIINLQEQLHEYRLALDSCRQDLDKRWMDIENLERSREEFLTVIQELRNKNNDLEIQIFVNLAFQQLVQKPLLVIPVEEEELSAQEVEEEKEEPSMDIDVQTKSWWRRQAERLSKVGKRMGTFCLGVMRCQRLRTCMRKVISPNQVHPICLLPV